MLENASMTISSTYLENWLSDKKREISSFLKSAELMGHHEEADRLRYQDDMEVDLENMFEDDRDHYLAGP